MAYHPSLHSVWQTHPEEVMIPIKAWTEVEIELNSILPRLQNAILDLRSAACSCFFGVFVRVFFVVGLLLCLVFFFHKEKKASA